MAPEQLDDLDRLAITGSHPAWILRALRSALLGHATATEDDVAQQLADLVLSLIHI